MKRLGSILLVLMVPATASAAELRTIPKGFQGHWSLTAEQCAPGPPDDANILIGERFIQDYSTRMAVRYVSVQGKDEIIAGGRVTSGSSRYDNVSRLALLENGTVLGVGEGEDHALYVRCKP